MFSYIDFHKLNHELLIVKHNACGGDQNYQQSVHSYPTDHTEKILSGNLVPWLNSSQVFYATPFFHQSC